jgi:hypothetical protein
MRPEDPLGLSSTELLCWPPRLLKTLTELDVSLDEDSRDLSDFLLLSGCVFVLSHEIAHFFSSLKPDSVQSWKLVAKNIAPILEDVPDEALRQAWLEEFRTDCLGAQIMASAGSSLQSKLAIHDQSRIDARLAWDGGTCLLLGGAVCLGALHAIDLYRAMDSSPREQRRHPMAGSRFCAWLRHSRSHTGQAEIEVACAFWHELNTLLLTQLDNLERRGNDKDAGNLRYVRRYLERLSEQLHKCR